MRGQEGAGLYDNCGRRKYLSHAEGARFLEVVASLPLREAALCEVLYWTGCRISEALELGPNRVDHESARLVLRTLKRHHRGQTRELSPVIFRTVPVSTGLIDALSRLSASVDGRYWPWSRQAAWRHIKVAMALAGVEGLPACPKGLRHHFGIMAASADIPPSLIKRWMGHAKLETTMIYLDAVGSEERGFAERMWKP